MQKPKQKSTLQRFTHFVPGMVHGGFPKINVLQLEAGTLQGWVYSEKVGPYHVNAGSFNRAVLCEGNYNQNRLHVGFILSSEHSVVVQAHEYDGGTLALHRGAVSMHEVFPAKMVWADISAPEEIIMQGVPYSKKQLKENPRLIIKGARENLIPLINAVTECIESSITPRLSNRLKHALKKLFESHFDAQAHDQPFSSGDRFRAHLIEEIHTLALTHKNKPLSLDEICKAAGMKRRTVQKYFHEIYGMGPTEYFRIRRLNGTRADLINGTSSVSEVALHWEFNHLGRFSGRYKAHFGESPKETRYRFAVSPKG